MGSDSKRRRPSQAYAEICCPCRTLPSHPATTCVVSAKVSLFVAGIYGLCEGVSTFFAYTFKLDDCLTFCNTYPIPNSNDVVDVDDYNYDDDDDDIEDDDGDVHVNDVVR